MADVFQSIFQKKKKKKNTVKLINKIVINQVISFWPSYGSSICCIGPRLWPGANTADLGPITEPIRNYFIEDGYSPI